MGSENTLFSSNVHLWNCLMNILLTPLQYCSDLLLKFPIFQLLHRPKWEMFQPRISFSQCTNAQSNMKEETLIMTSDPTDEMLLCYVGVQLQSLHTFLNECQWPVVMCHVSMSLFIQLFCEAGGSKLSFSHTVCLCHFYISQWSLCSHVVQ